MQVSAAHNKHLTFTQHAVLTNRKLTIQLTHPQPTLLSHPQLRRYPLLHRLDMTNHPNHLPRRIQIIQRIQSNIQRLRIQGAKPFIKKQRVNTGFMAHQVRQGQ
jgi:hypothetical protein